MQQLWPILAVVGIWFIVFVGSFWSYAKWLKIPTETEVEVEHEHQHEGKPAESPAAVH
jgi:hypothetical protein